MKPTARPKSRASEGNAGPGIGSRAPIPTRAPAFFRDAFARAQKSGRPIVIDFWATWCAPCKKLKLLTLKNPQVEKGLRSVELIFVDTDIYPELAKAYKVTSIPDVFFVDREGRITDRLRRFESAAPFAKRLQRLLAIPPASRPTSRPTSKRR